MSAQNVISELYIYWKRGQNGEGIEDKSGSEGKKGCSS